MNDTRIKEILDGIWYELMTMNAMRALVLVHDPCLSSEERGFVEAVASSVVENCEGSDGSGDNPDEDDEK